ncbi:MAG: hypothetical protein LBP94_01995 [Zoogloeaceae bacterium]|jgi:hypothetical protein|nr:hypothetical protein [Zoogloeaceae bacterium]
MPIDPITAAIVSSIVGGIVQDVANVPGPHEPVPAVGVPRILPENTKRGEFVVVDLTTAAINGQPMLMSPGVQIRDPFNMVVLPLQVQRLVPVRYQTDVSGAITKVWILSLQEAAQR